MARAEETTRQPTSFKVGPGEALIAVPTEDGGTIYYTSEEAMRADQTDETLQRALDLAGAWSDLDFDEAMDALDRIRHENPPSAPFTV
ncbi:MAG: hypothetical protein M3008_03785 [Chloroflexota bacterium]|nr:hypothetical protein [Chloroflexota bacterium]